MKRHNCDEALLQVRSAVGLYLSLRDAFSREPFVTVARLQGEIGKTDFC